ncbi:MAG: metallo-beta-lactamase family protein [Verrucomicrobiales bacterium]|nr:metallo-beta-lactamase family protein [Verrucomicrobiales bacterium]
MDKRLFRLSAWLLVAGMIVSTAWAGDLKVFYPPTHTGWVLQTPSGKVYVINPGVSAEFYGTAAKRGQGIGTYLKSLGIKTVHGVVISHPHPDHYAAGVELFRDFKVLELIDTGFNAKSNHFGGYNAAFWKAFQASGAKHRTGLRAGTALAWDPELTVKVLGPKEPFWTYADAGKDPERYYNENSLVLWVKHGAVSYLFTGDITPPAQNFLRLNAATEIRDTAILAIPHHGKYYHNDAFGKLVGMSHPSVRLGIASENHGKKGPKADTVPEWRRSGLNVYVGDGNNEVTVTSTGGAEFIVETTHPSSTKTYRIVSSPSPGPPIDRPIIMPD